MTVRELISRFTDHPTVVEQSFVDKIDPDAFWLEHEVRVSQLNEMLLALAYETISPDFFRSFEQR